MSNRAARILAIAMIVSSGIVGWTIRATPSDAEVVGITAVILGAIFMYPEWRKSISEEKARD